MVESHLCSTAWWIPVGNKGGRSKPSLNHILLRPFGIKQLRKITQFYAIDKVKVGSIQWAVGATFPPVDLLEKLCSNRFC